MMKQADVSDIVVSLAGRDKGLVLVVIRADERYLWVANGRHRRAESPKRKKRRHAALCGTCDERTRQKLLETGRLTNSDIRKALALWAGQSDPQN